MNKEQYKAHFRQRLYIKEDFVKDVKTIRATRDEFWRTGKPPAGISSVTSKSAADLGDRVGGRYLPGHVRTTIIEPKSNTSPGIIGLERNPRVEILDPNDAITALQKREAILTRSIRRNRNLEKAAGTAKTTGVHEFAHALQDQRQIQNELELYVQKHGKLPDPTWMRKSASAGSASAGLSFRETATKESRGKKRNRLKAEADGLLDLDNPWRQKAKTILTEPEADLQYWNRDIELHARSVQYADKLYDGRYKQGIQTDMKRKPNMSIDSILARHRNWAIGQVNRQEQGLTTPKNLRNIHQRIGLVMADIEKEMDLTSPEKIKAFRDSKLPPPTKPEFAKNLEPSPSTRIEKAVGVVDDLASAGKKLGKGVVNSIDVAIDPLGYALEKAAKGILDTVKGGVKSGVKEVVKGGVKGVVKGGVVSAVGGIIGDQLAKHVAVPALEELGVYDAVGAVSKKAFDNMSSGGVNASERVLAAGERLVDNPFAFALDVVTSPESFINPQGTTTITANTKTEIEKRKDFDNYIRKNPQLTNDEVLELTKKEEERMKKESPSDSEMTSKHTAPVVATSDKISNWFDRNVINPIFGESYDTSREQYKEYIRSLLLEKYSRI